MPRCPYSDCDGVLPSAATYCDDCGRDVARPSVWWPSSSAGRFAFLILPGLAALSALSSGLIGAICAGGFWFVLQVGFRAVYIAAAKPRVAH